MDLGIRCPGIGWHDTAVGSPQAVTTPADGCVARASWTVDEFVAVVQPRLVRVNTVKRCIVD